jgi:hypothetical protein
MIGFRCLTLLFELTCSGVVVGDLAQLLHADPARGWIVGLGSGLIVCRHLSTRDVEPSRRVSSAGTATSAEESRFDYEADFSAFTRLFGHILDASRRPIG